MTVGLMNSDKLTAYDRAMIALAARAAFACGAINADRLALIALRTMYRAGSRATTALRVFRELDVW